MTCRYERLVGVSNGVQQIFVEQLLAVLIIPMGGADLKLLAVLCGVQRQWPWFPPPGRRGGGLCSLP